MSSIRTLARAEGMIVIASIHQPSLDTLSQFTKVMFLAKGKLCFYGDVDELGGFFEAWGRPVGRFVRIHPILNFPEVLTENIRYVIPFLV